MRGFRYFSVAIFLSLILVAPPGRARGQQTVTLGNAIAALTGPWKFHIGDSPQATGAKGMAWAQPGFNDSAWGTMDLTPPPGSYNPIYGSRGYVPGWTARGYRGYSGYAWYRLRVNIQNNQSALSLKMPDAVDDAYQVYVNGKLTGQYGHFTTHGVTTYIAEPRAFPLPADLHSGPATIAIRMWMAPYTALVYPDAGGLHGPPVLGQTDTTAALVQMDWDAVNRSQYSEFFQGAILLPALIVAFGLFWLDPKEPAYLWLGLTCAMTLAALVESLFLVYSTWIDGGVGYLLQDGALIPAVIGLWVIFWAYWFHLSKMGHVHRVVWPLVALQGIAVAMQRAPLYGTVVPAHATAWLSPLTLTLKLLLSAVLVWVTVRGIRKNKLEGWLALPAVVLIGTVQYYEQLLVLHVPNALFQVFGVAIDIYGISLTLSLAIITVLMLRRFLHGQREREQWRMEIEQARSVQQVLIPEALPVLPGIALESEYRPAQQVGGDFFQIVRHPTDGSLLIVLGDVTGHGLQAAMLVSLLVGAIRSTSESNADPLFVLEAMNRRLIGRGQENATCLALRLAPDGACTLANAGHLPPYLNGKEMAMEGSLPLGVMVGAEFSRMNFQLRGNDRLILLTDGVIEAQNEKKELFGFARTSELVGQNKSAVEIAAAAQNFGQQDDITVVAVEFSGAASPAAVREAVLA